MADGGDLVAVVATLADDIGTPKRYATEKILFSVEGEADIVGENPQSTRWGEAVVLIRPCASANPKAIKVKARTVRRGKYAPAAAALSFVPGAPDVEIAGRAASAADTALREVEAQQEEFEAPAVR